MKSALWYSGFCSVHEVKRVNHASVFGFLSGEQQKCKRSKGFLLLLYQIDTVLTLCLNYSLFAHGTAMMFRLRINI